jgi:hypothetical protein
MSRTLDLRPMHDLNHTRVDACRKLSSFRPVTLSVHRTMVDPQPSFDVEEPGGG